MNLFGVMISLPVSFVLISGSICLSYFEGESKDFTILYYDIGMSVGLLLLTVLYLCQVSTIYSWVLILVSSVYGLYGTAYEAKEGGAEKGKVFAFTHSLSLGLLIVFSNIQIFS